MIVAVTSPAELGEDVKRTRPGTFQARTGCVVRQ